MGFIAEAVAAAGNAPQTLIDAIIALCSVALGGFGKYLLDRRNSSGRVDTSPADVLWMQSNKLLEATARDRDRAEGQRDKLIENQASHVVPALDALNKALQGVLDILRGLKKAFADLKISIDEEANFRRDVRAFMAEMRRDAKQTPGGSD